MSSAPAMFDHWSGRAEAFEAAASHNRLPDDWLRVLERAVGRGDRGAPARSALDLGCGTGACALSLARLGWQVTGLDGSEGMLAAARRAAAREGLGVEFIQAELMQARAPVGGVDLVTLRNVLWTLPDPTAAIRHARGLLAPRGRILVSDGLWRDSPDPRLSGIDQPMPYGCGVPVQAARDWLAKAGFNEPQDWADAFDSHPYGPVYDQPDPDRLIPFFLLTAARD